MEDNVKMYQNLNKITITIANLCTYASPERIVEVFKSQSQRKRAGNLNSHH